MLVRTKCLNGADFGSPGTVLVLVVPDIQPGRVPFELLRPREETLASVKKFIDERRLVGTTVRRPPRFMASPSAARLAVHSQADQERFKPLPTMRSPTSSTPCTVATTERGGLSVATSPSETSTACSSRFRG